MLWPTGPVTTELSHRGPDQSPLFELANKKKPGLAPPSSAEDQCSSWSPSLNAPTPLAFHDKQKKLGERRTAPTRRGFVAAISQATNSSQPRGFHQHVSDESLGNSE